MRMPTLGDNRRMWLGGGALVAALILLAGWFLVIHPELSAASSNREQTTAADKQNQVLQNRNDDLAAKNGDKGALQAGLSAAMAQLPSDGALPAFTRQLSAQASAAGVVLTSVIIGAAAPVPAAAGAAPAAGAGAGAAPATGAAPTTTAAPVSPAAGAGTAAAASAPTGLVQMVVTVNATGLGRHDLAFLRAIQWNGPRRALVTNVQLAPTSGTGSTGIDGSCNLSLTLTIFSAPLSPSAQADLDRLLGGK